MKKILLLTCLTFGIFAVVTTTSCTKQYVAPAVTTNQTVYANLTSSQWATTDTGKNYTTTITPPAGDSGFDLNAGILIYFTFDGGTTYEQIPETYQNVSYSYTYTAGVITLYAQSATGAEFISVPPNLTAKIIMVDSN